VNEDVSFPPPKSQESITREWDAIALERDSQLAGRGDLSFETVLEPWVMSHVRSNQSVIDVGCGTGRLTTKINREASSALGIDPSSRSIEIARARDSQTDFAVSTVEEWVANNPDAEFDLAVANMVLMDVVNLDLVCEALARLTPRGRILVTLTHPAFWPLYWGYASNDGFDYSRELFVEAPFRTEAHLYATSTTHVHRPLDRYFAALTQVGLEIVRLEELRGPEAHDKFPFPRFLGIEARPHQPR